MAQKKSGSRTKAKTAAPARGKTQKKPIRREVGAIVCLIWGVFTFIGYFVKDHWLIDGLCLYVFKGLFGWGFYVVPFCFFIASGILAFHRGLPVRGRLIAVALIPLFFGSVVHVFAGPESYGLDWLSIRSLYLGGVNLESGGVISGLLADVLERAVSIYGAAPALLIALFAMVFITARLSPKKSWMTSRAGNVLPTSPCPSRSRSRPRRGPWPRTAAERSRTCRKRRSTRALMRIPWPPLPGGDSGGTGQNFPAEAPGH